MTPLFLDFPALPAAEIERRRAAVRTELLEKSKHVREADFRAITVADLRILFDAIDRDFFDGSIARLTAARKVAPCGLKFSRRLTSCGGRTTRHVMPARLPFARKTYRYGIVISSFLLFENFRPGQRVVQVCGVECVSRLDALERVTEHEILHLFEFLNWGDSRCSKPRFQALARGWFGHESHKHALVTPREARQATRRPLSVTVGQRVRFHFAGRTMEGKVERVTRRATILVETPQGRPHPDGRRYAKYYVPLTLLEAAGVDSSEMRALVPSASAG